MFPPPASNAALAGVDLEIEPGSFVAVVGPSGGGKSTLLNTIGLLDRSTAGTYRLNGADVGQLTEQQLAGLRSSEFGFVFQNFHLLDSRPVIDSVELGLLYRASDRRERRATALQALEQVGLAAFADQTASRLSGGQRQRVAIARALSSDAPVVLADEPTGNLDSANGAQILELLKDLARQGRTVVLVTHDDEIAAAADRVVHIRDGRVERIEERDGAPAAEERSSLLARTASTSPRSSRVRFRDVVVDALSTIGSRAARSAGLIGAVATAVGLAVTTLGLSDSAAAQVSDRFDAHANRDVSVSWQRDEPEDRPWPSVEDVLRDSRQVVGLDAAAVLLDRGSTRMKVTDERASLQAKVVSTSEGIEDAARLTVRWAPHHRDFLQADEVLVGESLSRQLLLGPLAASPTILLDGVDAHVVGIIEGSPREPSLLGAVVSSPDQHLGLPPASQGTLLLRTHAGAAQQVARQIRLAISPSDPGRLSLSAPADPTTLRGEIESDVRTTLVAFTAVALLAAIAALANAMVLAVLERRREFGLRKALGARKVHIAGLVLTESSIIGLAGGAAGFLAGMICVLAVTVVRHWNPVFDFRIAPVAIAGGMVAGGIGGILAALQAVRVQAQDALRG